MPDEEQRPLPGPVLRTGAAYAWRLLILAAALYVVVRILGHLLEVLVPVAVALLLTALLQPLLTFLRGRGLSQGPATLASFLSALILLGGLITLVVIRAVNQLPEVGEQIDALLPHLQHWLRTGPLQINAKTVDNLSATVSKEVSKHSSALISAAATTSKTVVDVATGIVLCFFVTVFFLYDGPRIWHFLTLMSPVQARDKVDAAGRAAWITISHYVRGTLVVALFHGIAIAIVLTILGVPLVLPLAVVVAIGSFVPIVGAVVTGLVAVGVAGVTQGTSAAIIVIIVLVADNQVESHVLQPFVVGRYVRIHPLATVISLTAGAVLAGILGAIFAVPLVACISAAVRTLVSQTPDQPTAPIDDVPAQRDNPGSPSG